MKFNLSNSLLNSPAIRTGWMVASMLLLSASAHSQGVFATLPTGTNPLAVAVNPVTNQIYVANSGSNDVAVFFEPFGSAFEVAVGTTPFAIAVNPVTNKIYVANIGSANVTVIDGATYKTTTVPAGMQPYALAVDPVTNQIYVANYGSATVTVIDGATNATSTVAAGRNPYSIAVNPVTNKIYAANYGSANVTVIEGASKSTTTVAVGSEPDAVAVNVVTNKIYIANYNGASVTVIDGTSNSTGTVNAGENPDAIAVNSVTNKIYAANLYSVTVIDGASNETTSVTVGTKPVSIAVNTTTNQIYTANNGSSNVTVIDGVSNAITSLAAGTNPVFVTVNPVTNKVYAANHGTSTLTMIDGATNQIATLSIGCTASAVAANPVTNKIYFACSNNTVAILDGATNSVTSVAVGTKPVAIAVNPVTNTIYTANYDSDDVTVIDGSDNSTTTMAVGTQPSLIAVNPVTNMMYVSVVGTYYGNPNNGGLTLIDGVSHGIATIPTGQGQGHNTAMAIDPATNRVYVATGPATFDGQGYELVSVDGVTNNVSGLYYVRYPISGLAVSGLFVCVAYSDEIDCVDDTGGGSHNETYAKNPGPIFVDPSSGSVYVQSDGVVTVNDYVTTVPVGGASNILTLNPVTGKVYAVSSTTHVAVIDGTGESTQLNVGITPKLMAVNPVTNKIYIAGTGNSVAVIDEQMVQASPLTTTIVPLAGNQTVETNPIFLFDASATANSVFFQLDNWQNTWSAAAQSGSNYSGPLASAPLGFHFLYAYAGDGQEATSTQSASPAVGGIQAYGFLVGSPALRSQFIAPLPYPINPLKGTSFSPVTSSSSLLPITYTSGTTNVCTFSGTTLSFITTGNCVIVASQSGNSVYAAAKSQQLTIAVNASTVTTLALSPSTSYYGQPIALTATVTSNAGTPTGSVYFYYVVNGINYYFGGGQLNPSGVLSLVSPPNVFPLGTNQVKAAYSRNGFFLASSSNPLPETVLPGPASVISLSPSSGSGFTQSFTAVYSDTNSASALYNVAILVDEYGSSKPIGEAACAVLYFPNGNNLYLLNDEADGGSSITPGSSGSVSNSQCTLSGAGSSVTKSGNNLTVTYALTFSPSFLHAKNHPNNVYIRSEDHQSSDSGWVLKGGWGAP